MHKHYANRPYCDDVVTATGKLDVKFGWLVKLLSPFLRLFGTLVPHQGQNIPVTVHFRSELDSKAFCLDRNFDFTETKPYIFYSRLVPLKEDIVIEFMKFGIGWKHRFYYDGTKVILEHRGYVWKLFGTIIPVPINLFLGHGYAEEEALSNNTFHMKMNLTHPLFGKMYEYSGTFEVQA
jgi:hypothetical protein